MDSFVLTIACAQYGQIFSVVLGYWW